MNIRCPSTKWTGLLLAVFVLLPGCVESQAKHRAAPFKARELDACLAIVVDMSGSFRESWEDRAYELFLQLSDQYFTETMGGETRLVIGQLSDAQRVILFEGRPIELQERFQSPQQLCDFLKRHSDEGSSHVYEATASAVDYVGAMSGITERTRLLTVVFSDLKDSVQDPAARRASGYRMIDSLKEYQQKGGSIAFYFVDPDETSRWQQILKEAGFEAGQYVIENDLTARPELPRFD